MSDQATKQQVADNTAAINSILENSKDGSELPEVDAGGSGASVIVYDADTDTMGKAPTSSLPYTGPEIPTGGTVVDTPGTVTQRRVSINLLDENATWETGATIPINPGDDDLSSVASATKSISPLIPIKDGDYLKRVNLDTFRFVRSDGTTIVPFDDPVYNNNNRLSSIKIVFDDPSDDIAYIQVALLDTNIGVTDMLVHFRDCDTSGNPVVVPTGWDDYDVYVDDFDEWDVNRVIKEKVDGLNLYDPTTAYYAGYYQQATGAFNKSFPSTGLLPASPNDWYSINTSGNVQITFFDDTKTFISGSGTIGKTAQAPALAAYVSFQLPSHTIDYYSIIVTRSKAIEGTEKRYRYRFIGEKDIFNHRIAVIGDSIATEGGSYADIGYPTLLRKALNAPSLQNYSISGDKFEDFADNYTFYNEDNTLCLIALGTNDWGYGNDSFGTIADTEYEADPADYPDTTFGNIAKLYHQILDDKVDTLVAFISPIHRINENTTNLQGKTLEDYVNAIEEFCTYWSVPFLNLYKVTHLNPARADMLPYYFSSDGIHPTDAAHEMFIAPKVIEFVKGLSSDWA